MINITAITQNYADTQKACADAIRAMTPCLNQLLTNYENWGSNYVNQNEIPETAISEFLKNLDIYYPGATKRKLKLAIKQFITDMPCFTYRVIALSTEGESKDCWNPLEISFDDFCSQFSASEIDIHYRSTNTHHPAQGLISDWIKQSIDEPLFSE